MVFFVSHRDVFVTVYRCSKSCVSLAFPQLINIKDHKAELADRFSCSEMKTMSI